MSSAQSSNAAAASWPSAGIGPDQVQRDGVYELVAEISDLPIYNIRNGDPALLQPYLQRSTVPAAFRWVPVGGIEPRSAMKVVDAFVKGHLYQMALHAPAELPQEMRRKAAIILGVTRAVMTATYGLTPADMNVTETAGPFINATLAPDGTVGYRVVAPADPAAQLTEGGTVVPAPATGPSSYLTDELRLTEEERDVVKVLVKLGLTIIPIQGHNLVTDGHHYLSGSSKSSFRACVAIEKQLVVGQGVKDWLNLTEPAMRDFLWHKAGHPVSVMVKQEAATSSIVAANLVKMNIGSAATRLPAIESEARPISAYIKLTDAVRTIFESYDGEIDNKVLVEAMEALSRFPIGAEQVEDPAVPGQMLELVIGTNLQEHLQIRVRNRKEVLETMRSLVARNQDKMAQVFGFYTCMVERANIVGEMVRSERGGESLSKAYSLIKLKGDCVANYVAGRELYQDYVTVRQKARQEGVFAPPKLIMF